MRLIRLGAATHSFDHNTRMMELAFTEPAEGTLRISAPANGQLAPPGYYMLFVCENKNGGSGGNFPSEGTFVKLANAPS